MTSSRTENSSRFPRLAQILEEKRKSLANASYDLDAGLAKIAQLAPAKDFGTALRMGSRVSAIAEFKRASPSEGLIRPGAAPGEIARVYQQAGASAISVLCDAHFRGSLEDLREVRKAVDLPVLCKDFILEPAQLVQARLAGADAALLIVAALSVRKLRELYAFAQDIGLEVLVEIHDAQELEVAMHLDAQMIGINNRDLQTFNVEFDRCLRLTEMIPSAKIRVAESGIQNESQVQALADAGVDAMLVGTHLMRAQDPGKALLRLWDIPT